MNESVAFLAGGGEMGGRIRMFDWASTPLGDPRGWSQSLRCAVGICLKSTFPIAIYWGPNLRLIYNDSWAPIPGKRHPAALGLPGAEVWPDIWHIVGPQFAEVMASGEGLSTTDQHLPMTRSGRLEESYWDYGFTPITDDDGSIAGIMNQGHEVTARVFERQRHALLLGLTDRLRALDDAEAIVAEAIEVAGPQLDVARAGYAEIDLAAGTFRIVHNWRRDAQVADMAGTHTLGSFGADLHAALLTGAIFSVDDALSDPRVANTAAAAVYAAAGIRAGLVVPVLKNGVYAAAVFIHDDRPRYWTPHHEALLSSVAERVWQESNRARADRAVRASEERYRLIFEQANDIIFAADLDQIVTAANPAAGAALGQAAGDLIGRSIAEFVSTDDFALTSDMLRRKLHGGGTTQYEVPVRAADGKILRWEINSSLAIDHVGAPIGLHAIARDVTERHAYESNQRRLIHELNHRVKNMLAQVQALAMQSFKADRPIAEAQQAFQARLSALARAHDLLTREKWESTTLEDIVVAAALPFAQAPDQVSYGGPTTVLPPKTAVSLIMAFHEMATNAARFGALSTAGGHLTIMWHHAPGDRLAIEWREDRGPEVAPPARRGFGLRLVERALATDLAAKVAIDFPAGGLVCTIEAPLPPPPRPAATIAVLA